MRRPLRVAALTIALAVLVATSAAGGFLVGREDPGILGPFPSARADPTLDMTAFWEAWNYLRSEFYKQPVDREALVRGAVRGLLSSSGDDNTGYLDPQNADLFSSQLERSFEGIGATVGTRDGLNVIVAPMPGSPAEKAGIKPGDAIVKIDGQDATHLSLIDATTKIRGKKGTQVVLTVRRPADASRLDPAARATLLAELPALEEALTANDVAGARAAAGRVNDALAGLSGATVDLDITVTRDTILQVRVEQKMLEGGVAYLKLGQFYRGSSSDFDDALATLLKQSPTGIVLDLRSDGGGFVNEAVAIASQFLPSGTLIYTEERADATSEQRARPGGRALSLPLVVLVDRGTASASEIVSGALRDDGRAKLVGEKTYGKGTEQLAFALSDGGTARITIARWLTPKGTWVNHNGLDPDYAVSPADAGPPDLALQKALELLRH